MSIDSSYLASLILIITSISAGFLTALWIALIIWTYRDIRSRTRDRLVQVLAAVLAFLLFLPGLIVYLILRPQKTLEEEYQQSLEEEALLQNFEEQKMCPGCERYIEPEWIICPTCQTRLTKACQQCGKVLDLGWNICPFCCTPVPGMRIEAKRNNTDDGGISDGKDLEG
jgi:RNA polymerase subunit RPABC4/transcription elongation factor Spt4